MEPQTIRELIQKDIASIFSESNLLGEARWIGNMPQPSGTKTWVLGITGHIEFTNMPGGVDTSMALNAVLDENGIVEFTVARIFFYTRTGEREGIKIPHIYISSDEDKRLKKCLKKSISTKVFASTVEDVIEEIHTRVVKSIIAQSSRPAQKQGT